MIRNKIAALLLLVAIVTVVSACGDDQEGAPTTEATTYDIVCLSEVGNTGSVFTLTKPQGKQLISYTVNGRIDTTRIKLGDRIMLAYRTSGQEPYKSGGITPLGYSLINNDNLYSGYISKIPDWDKDPVYMISTWMSQDYLNMRVRLPYIDKARVLGVMLDSLTIDNEYPDCYLVHQIVEPINTFDRSYYISVDMRQLHKLANCHGFNLKVNNSNMDIDTYTFTLQKYR